MHVSETETSDANVLAACSNYRTRNNDVDTALNLPDRHAHKEWRITRKALFGARISLEPLEIADTPTMTKKKRATFDVNTYKKCHSSTPIVVPSPPMFDEAEKYADTAARHRTMMLGGAAAGANLRLSACLLPDARLLKRRGETPFDETHRADNFMVGYLKKQPDIGKLVAPPRRRRHMAESASPEPLVKKTITKRKACKVAGDGRAESTAADEDRETLAGDDGREMETRERRDSPTKEKGDAPPRENGEEMDFAEFAATLGLL